MKTIETKIGQPVTGDARVGDCISIPTGRMAGIWEVGSMWFRGAGLGVPPEQHPCLCALSQPVETHLPTYEELAALGATYCARPAARPWQCAAARPDGTYRCQGQAEDGSDYCRRHAPCSVCGELRGPVPHYASTFCRCGGQPHCTCSACF